MLSSTREKIVKRSGGAPRRTTNGVHKKLRKKSVFVPTSSELSILHNDDAFDQILSFINENPDLFAAENEELDTLVDDRFETDNFWYPFVQMILKLEENVDECLLQKMIVDEIYGRSAKRELRNNATIDVLLGKRTKDTTSIRGYNNRLYWMNYMIFQEEEISDVKIHHARAQIETYIHCKMCNMMIYVTADTTLGYDPIAKTHSKMVWPLCSFCMEVRNRIKSIVMLLCHRTFDVKNFDLPDGRRGRDVFINYVRSKDNARPVTDQELRYVWHLYANAGPTFQCAMRGDFKKLGILLCGRKTVMQFVYSNGHDVNTEEGVKLEDFPPLYRFESYDEQLLNDETRVYLHNLRLKQRQIDLCAFERKLPTRIHATPAESDIYLINQFKDTNLGNEDGVIPTKCEKYVFENYVLEK